MKTKNNKLNIKIMIAVVALVGVMMVAVMLSACTQTNATPPPSSEPTSSVSSTPSSEIVVEPISIPESSSKAPSSEATITVKGDVGDNTSSASPTSSKPKNDKNEGVASKQEQAPSKEVESQPSNDPNNPTEGTNKVDENGDTWTYLEGKWWNDGPMNQQTNEDGDKLFGPCRFCGEIDCICPPVGY